MMKDEMEKGRAKGGLSISTQSEPAKEFGFKNFIDSVNLMMDLKMIIKEFYIATFDEDGQSLNIAFNNGQKFKITVSKYGA